MMTDRWLEWIVGRWAERDGRTTTAAWVPYVGSCLACGGGPYTSLVGHGPNHFSARIGQPCPNCERHGVVAWHQKLESEK